MIMEDQINAFLKHRCRHRNVRFWGQEYRIKPYLISSIDGDGLQIVYVEPITTRPNYYVLRIDSSHDISSDEFDYDNLLLTMIEEECDNAANYHHEWRRGKYVGKRFDWHKGDVPEWQETEFPMLNWDGGMWGVISNFKDATTEIVMARNIKEAKRIAYSSHGEKAHYVAPYRYASKGNNFYEFLIEQPG